MHCSYCRTVNPDDGLFCSACGRDLAPTSNRKPVSDPIGAAATEFGLAAGTILLKRYRIQRQIGIGGMGRVYQAEDEALRLPVAIKVMRDILSRDAGSVARLKSEARHSMALTHPNIVRVHNFEEDGDLKFLTMEFVDGESLAQLLAASDRFPEGEARRIAVEICRGLEHAHSKGIVHRDLKPGNVMLGKDGSVKIADFGIARACRDSVSRLTGALDSGTLLYMSPEQVMGETSPQSDLYSLGVVLYELVTGDPPFYTGDITAQIRGKAPKPIEGVSPAMNALVLRCLEKQAADRFPTVAELCRELDGTAERERQEALLRIQAEAAELSPARERSHAAKEPRPPTEERKSAESAPRVGKPPDRGTPVSPVGSADDRLPQSTRGVETDIAAQERTDKPEKKAAAWNRRSVSSRIVPWLVRLALGLAAVVLMVAGAYFVWAWHGGYVAAKDLPAIQRLKGEDPDPRPGDRWTSPGDGREMVWIPPGSFQMGTLSVLRSNGFSELKHTVRVERGFWMDVNEVTNADYQRFVYANPQWQKGRAGQRLVDEEYLKLWNGFDYPPGKADHPVLCVSWHASRAYAQWAGKRLPTEAEWEYACRAGTQSEFWWGDTFADVFANNSHNTLPVGDERRRNPWGLYDMLGNAGEWTSSLSSDYPYRSDDGREDPEASGDRVARGGFIHGHPTVLRSAVRLPGAPTYCTELHGFRCAR